MKLLPRSFWAVKRAVFCFAAGMLATAAHADWLLSDYATATADSATTFAKYGIAPVRNDSSIATTKVADGAVTLVATKIATNGSNPYTAFVGLAHPLRPSWREYDLTGLTGITIEFRNSVTISEGLHVNLGSATYTDEFAKAGQVYGVLLAGGAVNRASTTFKSVTVDILDFTTPEWWKEVPYDYPTLDEVLKRVRDIEVSPGTKYSGAGVNPTMTSQVLDIKSITLHGVDTPKDIEWGITSMYPSEGVGDIQLTRAPLTLSGTLFAGDTTQASNVQIQLTSAADVYFASMLLDTSVIPVSTGKDSIYSFAGGANDLAEGTSYRWRARVRAQSDTGAWGEASFTTAPTRLVTTLGTISAVSPSGMTNLSNAPLALSGTLVVADSSQRNSVHLQLRNSADPSVIVLDTVLESSYKGTESSMFAYTFAVDASGLYTSAQYMLRARTLTSSDTSAWDSVSFTTRSADTWTFKDFNAAETATPLISDAGITGASWTDGGTVGVSRYLPSDLSCDGWSGDSAAVITVTTADKTNVGVIFGAHDMQPMDLRHATLSMKLQDAAVSGTTSLDGWDVRLQIMSSYRDAKIKSDSGITLGFDLSKANRTRSISTTGPQEVAFLLDTASFPSWPSKDRLPKAAVDSILATVTGFNISLYTEYAAQGQTAYLIVDDIKLQGIPTTGPVGPVNRPVLVNPAPNATGVEQGIAFKWTRGANHGNTQLQLSKSPAFSSLLLDSLVSQDSSILVYTGEMELNTKYYWRVRCQSAGGWSGWSRDSFTTVNPPLARPEMVSPTSAQTTWKTWYPFKWRAMAGADSIRLQVVQGQDFSGRKVLDTAFRAPTDTTFALKDSSTLKWSTGYSVRIKGMSANGDFSAFSVPLTFTTMMAPPSDTIMTMLPSGTAKVVDTFQTLSGTFHVSDTASKDSVRIQVTKAVDASFTTAMLDTVIVPIYTGYDYCYNNTTYKYDLCYSYSYSLNVSGLDWKTNYLWRAQLRNATDGGPWKQTTFKTADTSLAKITLKTPANKAVNVSRGTLVSWLVNGATSATDSVILQVSGNSRFEGVSWYSCTWWNGTSCWRSEFASHVLDTSYVYTARLQLSKATDSTIYTRFVSGYGLDTVTTYYLRIRRRNAAGNYSPWTYDTFTTVYAAPNPTSSDTLLSPNSYYGRGANTPVNATLAWNSVARADSFEVLVWKGRVYDKLNGNSPRDTIYHAMVDDTVAAVNGLLNDTTYSWSIRAKSNAAGWGNWWGCRAGASSATLGSMDVASRDPATFTVVTAAPVKPTLLVPASNADTVDMGNAVLVWSDGVRRVDTAFVELSATRNFSADVRRRTLSNPMGYMPGFPSMGIGADTSTTFSDLTNLTQYFWRVRTVNAGGSSDWSNVDSFMTKVGLPTTPTLLMPLEGAADISLAQELSWNRFKGTDNDSIQVATDDRFTKLVSNFATTTTAVGISGLLNQSTYYWRVKANNSVGSSVWSTVRTFTTVGLPPAVPVLVSPLDGKVNAPVNDSLKWKRVARAASYRMQLSKTSAFSSNVLDMTLADTLVYAQGLENGVTYYWRVAASNKGGSSGWSNAMTFTTIVAAPQRPTLLLPATNAQGVSTSPILRWNKAKYAVRYDVQVATNSSFTAIVNSASTADTGVAISSLQYLTKFYWRVRSTNSGGNSAWSGTDSFTTILGVPSVPSIVGPTGGITGQPVDVPLTWKKVAYADSFRVQLSTASDFSTLVKDVATKDTSLGNLGLSNITTYYWRVRSKNIVDASAWSATSSFTTIVAVPSAPAVFSPANGATKVAMPVVLSWKPASHVDSVQVQVSSAANFATILKDVTVSGAGTNVSIPGLSQFTTYYWKARAKNVAGTSAWSGAWSFKTQDTSKPVFKNVPTSFVAKLDSGKAFATVTWTAPTASDNDGVKSFTANHNPGERFSVGKTTVAYEAVDSSGNTATASFDITVVDAMKPVISGMPADIRKATDKGVSTAVVSWTAPTASDNIGVKSFTGSVASGSKFSVGTTVVKYTAVDTAGNTTIDSFKVVVIDTAAPVFANVPSPISALTGVGSATATVAWTVPTATDNVGVSSLTSNYKPGAGFPVGVTTVTYVAVDAAGNTAKASFTVTVAVRKDTTHPVIKNMPASIKDTTDAGKATAVVTWTAPTATDEVKLVSLASNYKSGSAFRAGKTVVRYTATDSSGNTAVDSFTVTVVDIEKPALSAVPASRTVSTDKSGNYALVTWTAPTASDNVGVKSISSNFAPGAKFWVGTTTVVYTVVDTAGNRDSASFTVTVRDSVAPVISGVPSTITKVAANGAKGANVSWEAPTAKDNVELKSIACDYTSGSVFPIGTTKVTCTATDAAGNVSRASFDVKVEVSTAVARRTIDGPTTVVDEISVELPNALAGNPGVGAGAGSIELDFEGTRVDGQAIRILLPDRANVSVVVFDNQGAPVIWWNKDLAYHDLWKMPKTDDGRRALNLVWNLRDKNGAIVYDGVYLWKVKVNAGNGETLDHVYKLGVKNER